MPVPDQPVTAKSPADSIGYFCGNWIASSEMRLSIHDIGFRQGVTAVERLRTYNKNLFFPERHLHRWERTTQSLFIDALPDKVELLNLLRELLRRNAAFVDRNRDVGVTMIATPGDPASGNDSQPTLAVHLNVIDHEIVASRRSHGQPIVVTAIVQPPNESWSRDIKVRSRIHYFLADKTARRLHRDAIGVLVDDDGTVTETSTSNIAIVTNGKIVSPPKENVLSGVTQSVVEEIAADEKLEWEHRPITAKELKAADEVLLMGTTGGIWFANRIDESDLLHKPRPVYSQLLANFDEFTGRV